MMIDRCGTYYIELIFPMAIYLTRPERKSCELVLTHYVNSKLIGETQIGLEI